MNELNWLPSGPNQVKSNLWFWKHVMSWLLLVTVPGLYAKTSSTKTSFHLKNTGHHIHHHIHTPSNHPELLLYITIHLRYLLYVDCLLHQARVIEFPWQNISPLQAWSIPQQPGHSNGHGRRLEDIQLLQGGALKCKGNGDDLDGWKYNYTGYISLAPVPSMNGKTQDIIRYKWYN